MKRRDFLYASMAAMALPAAARAESDADYPSHPLKLVVNNPPGGAADIMARIIAERCGHALGQPVVVDNRPGLSTGPMFVAHQPANGYTVMLGTFSVFVTQPLLWGVPYDTQKDFDPVALVATAPIVMVVKGDAPYDDLKGFIAAARAAPAPFNFGSGGVGTLAHLLPEMMNEETGLNMQHVPYKGSIQALNDLIAGQIQFVFGDPQAVLSLIQAKQLKAIAVTTPERSPLLPDVPTLAESGLPQLIGINPWGLFMPAGVPQPVFDKFYKALQIAMTDPGLVAKFAAWGVKAEHSTPGALRQFTVDETAKYAKIIKERNIKKA